MLQHEKEEQNVLKEEIEALKKQAKHYQEQILTLSKEKEKLAEAAEIDAE